MTSSFCHSPRRLPLLLLLLCISATAHAFAATTTTLTFSVAGSPVTTVNVGTAVTFTAAVTVAGAPITTGQVTFCDADAAFCNDIHRIGTAQVLANGTATLNVYLPSGAHHYKAITTVAGATSSSATVPITVTPPSLTPTTTVVTGTTNGTLTATINHVGNPFPHTGTVTFTDTDTSSTLGTILLAGTPTAIQYPVAGGGFSSTTGFLFNNDIPILLLPADFNNDGRPDLLVTFTQGAQSTTNGTFPSSVVQISQPGSPNTPISKPIALPSGCRNAAIADFNHDGNLDIAAFITGGSAPSVLTGNGDGTFSTPAFAAGAACSQVLSGDFNLDGLPDLAVLTGSQIALWKGAGDGTFTLASTLSLLGIAPFFMQTGDFNGDGKPDLVAADNRSTIDVFLNYGDGTFAAPVTTSGPFNGIVADFNNDGRSDLFSPSAVLLSNADGTFTQVAIAAPSIGPMTAGDFNGDGIVDIAVGQSNIQPNQPSFTNDLAAYILLGNGDGTFGTPINVFNSVLPLQPEYASNTAAQSIAAIDWNGDGVPDILLSTRLSAISRQQGLPNINEGVEIPLLSLPAITNYISFSPISVPARASSTANISIVYSGDTNYATSQASATFTGTISTLALTASNTTPLAGVAVQFTATLSPYTAQGLSTDGETVTFLNNGQTLGTATLAGGVATLSTANLSATTTNQVTATFPGDGHFAAAASSVVRVNVTTTSTALNLTASSTTPLAGIPVQFTATLSPSTVQGFSTDGEIVTFLNNGQTLGTGTLSGGVATLSTANLSATSANQITAVFPGDTHFAYALSSSVTVNVTPASTILTFAIAGHTYGDSPFSITATSPSTGAITYSLVSGPATIAGSTVTITGTGTVTLQASIAAAGQYPAASKTATFTINMATLTATANSTARVFGAANPAFTGAITGAVYGNTFTETFATAATPASIVGSYPIQPSVSGSALANYNVVTTNGALTVTQASTATTFVLSNGNTTYTATVASLTSGLPTGSVIFYQGQTPVGTGTLSNGTATVTTTAPPTGNVVLSAQYSGDANFTQSAAPPIVLLAVNAASNALAVSTAGSTTDTLTVTGAPGYTGTVTLSCSNLPANATCSFAPSTVGLSSSVSSATVTATIRTGVSTTATLNPSTTTLFAALCAPTLFGMALFRRRRILRNLILPALLFTATAALLSGCGGSNTPSAPTPPATTTTPSGTYQVGFVTSGPNGLSSTTPVTLTVQ